jgi:hypothetical protein
MNIIIKTSNRWTQKDWDKKEQRLGIKIKLDSNNDIVNYGDNLVYEVLDKHLFMLTVIKYNIEFEEI